jgi:MFS family permease
MFTPTVNFADVTHAIQLALAPVFLLTGIAGLLNVMAGRLARIIDRGRRLTEDASPPKALTVELDSLDQRRYLASAAITACTFSALMVCMVIAALFLEVLLQISLKWLVGLSFTGSTLALVVGLAYFLREVHLATQTVRFPVPGHKNRV